MKISLMANDLTRLRELYVFVHFPQGKALAPAIYGNNKKLKMQSKVETYRERSHFLITTSNILKDKHLTSLMQSAISLQYLVHGRSTQPSR